MKKILATFSLLVASSSIAFAQDALSGAQQNYKRCPIDAMKKGVEVVSPVCGKLKAAPEFPSYDEAWGRITAGEVQAGHSQLVSYSQ